MLVTPYNLKPQGNKEIPGAGGVPKECPTTLGILGGPSRYPTESPTASRKKEKKNLTFTQQDQQTKTLEKVSIFCKNSLD